MSSAGAALALIALTAVGAERSPTGPLRAAIRIAADVDRALLDRIRGQTSDLPIQILARATDPIEATLRERVASADRIGREEGNVRAVVWFELTEGTRGSTLTVSVADLESGRLLLRVLPGPVGSAMLEAAALLVRTALRRIVLGEPIGLERSAALEPKPAPAPARVSTAPIAIEPPGQEWRLRLGFALAGDGVTPLGARALVASLERAGGSLAAGIAIEVGLPAKVTDALSEIDVSRHAVTASLGIRSTGTLRAKAGVRAGAAMFYRRTISTASGVLASPGRGVAGAIVGPEVELVWEPAEGFEVALGSSLDVVPSAPTFAYDDGGAIVEAHRAWRIEPRVLFGVGAAL